jgi:hypothetical protein
VTWRAPCISPYLLDPDDARDGVFRSSAMPRAPHASDALVDGVSGALFVWLLHPPESFWVNLSPTGRARQILLASS